MLYAYYVPKYKPENKGERILASFVLANDLASAREQLESSIQTLPSLLDSNEGLLIMLKPGDDDFDRYLNDLYPKYNNALATYKSLSKTCEEEELSCELWNFYTDARRTAYEAYLIYAKKMTNLGLNCIDFYTPDSNVVVDETDKYLTSKHTKSGSIWKNIYLKVPEKFVLLTEERKRNLCDFMDRELYWFLNDRYGITVNGTNVENGLHFSYVGDKLIFKPGVAVFGISIGLFMFEEKDVDAIIEKVAAIFDSEYHHLISKLEFQIFG